MQGIIKFNILKVVLCFDSFLQKIIVFVNLFGILSMYHVQDTKQNMYVCMFIFVSLLCFCCYSTGVFYREAALSTPKKSRVRTTQNLE